MARLAHNMERHPNHKGQYIAYDADGFAFRVDRAMAGNWRAKPSYAAAAQDARLFFADRLEEMAAKVGASRRPYQTRAAYFRLVMAQDAAWLVDCAANPSPFMKPRHVALIRLALRKKGN